MTTAVTYDRKTIMTRAWERVRKANTKLYGFRLILSRALRAAWANAKHEAAMAALEGKDRWTAADYATRDKLGEALRVAQDHAATAPDYAGKRGLIEAEKGRFAFVTFTKKDGAERTMKVQPATLKAHVKGDDATDAGKQAVATRKARHPNLLPIWDMDKQAIRSINLATVTRIAAGGAVHTYQ